MQKGDWRSWLTRHREQSSMRAEVVPISQVGDWQVLVDESGQAVSVGRADKKFHEAVTVRVSNARREVPDYSTLLFREATKPGEEGVMVLVGDGQGNFLIQAKAEPGNDTEGKVLLAATLQVSRANLGQAHGGVYLREQSSSVRSIPPDGASFGLMARVFSASETCLQSRLLIAVGLRQANLSAGSQTRSSARRFRMGKLVSFWRTPGSQRSRCHESRARLMGGSSRLKRLRLPLSFLS